MNEHSPRFKPRANSKKSVQQEINIATQKPVDKFQSDVNTPQFLPLTLLPGLPDRYVGDFSAVVEGCRCYCCVNHTKAYINHLINAKELLAGVLLMM